MSKKKVKIPNFKKFVKKYCKFDHHSKGTISVEPGEYLDILCNHLEHDQYLVIKKTRQMLVSSIALFYALWASLTNKDHTIFICGITDMDVRAGLMQKLVFAIENLPKEIRPNIIRMNLYSIEFSNGSSIHCYSQGGMLRAARGYKIDLLIFDEVAFLDNAEEIYSALYPAAQNGKIFLISTPYERKGFFYSMWRKARMNRSEFKPISLHYSQNPFFTKEKITMFKKSMGKKAFEREIEGKFVNF